MKLKILQDNLRKILGERIDAGEVTRLRLARRAEFKMDKVLAVQHLSVLDLLDIAEVNKRASILPPGSVEFEKFLLTDASTAATQPLVVSMHVKEILKFRKNFLRNLKAATAGDRSGWYRFVLIQLDAREAMSMYPRLIPGATLLIVRHYNSLKPYRKGEFNMYAVLKNNTCAVR